jgi:urease accessory protein
MMLAPRSPASLVSLLQLSSPTLPVGAFAFSQGLEMAVELGWITDEASARAWLEGALDEGLVRLDLPILARLYRACAARDDATFSRWSEYLLASRESLERRLEDEQLARALGRLLTDRGISHQGVSGNDDARPHAALFAVASVALSIPLADALLGFAFSWTENQVGALSRLVPLGQLAAQRVLTALGAAIPDAVSVAQTLSDAELGSCMPRLAVASALHETQYTRLFKS